VHAEDAAAHQGRQGHVLEAFVELAPHPLPVSRPQPLATLVVEAVGLVDGLGLVVPAQEEEAFGVAKLELKEVSGSNEGKVEL